MNPYTCNIYNELKCIYMYTYTYTYHTHADNKCMLISIPAFHDTSAYMYIMYEIERNCDKYKKDNTPSPNKNDLKQNICIQVALW